MEQRQSLKVLKLRDFKSLDENQICVLGAYSRPGFEIELYHCRITIAGASALTEVLGRNQGPTKLHQCDANNFILADGLRGNSRLKSFNPAFSGNRDALAIAGALRENKGLVDLSLSCCDFIANDETWGAVCDSLKTHPTLEVLNLFATSIYFRLGRSHSDVIASRMQAYVDMMKVNMSINTIHFDSSLCIEQKLFRGSVIPYLETNRLRPRLLAIQKARSITYRAKVLGRALRSARTNANRFWMLLSGNADVAFPSRATTIAVAADLPTPATAAATGTSTANVSAVASSMKSALTVSPQLLRMPLQVLPLLVPILLWIPLPLSLLLLLLLRMLLHLLPARSAKQVLNPTRD
jgi:hypothetical protein